MHLVLFTTFKSKIDLREAGVQISLSHTHTCCCSVEQNIVRHDINVRDLVKLQSCDDLNKVKRKGKEEEIVKYQR